MPTLLLLKGSPGTGQSSLAHELAVLLWWPVLDKASRPPPALPLQHLLRRPPSLLALHSRVCTACHCLQDDIRDAFEALLTANQGLRAALDWNELSYAVLFSLVAAQLRYGLSVVVDCPLARRPLYDRAAGLAREVRW